MNELIERLDLWIAEYDSPAYSQIVLLLKDCKEALEAKHVGEPVAWMYSVGDRKEVLFREFPQDELVDGCSVTPLYTLPPNIDALIAERSKL